MANGSGFVISQEVKRLIVVAVVSVVAQIVGWVAGANIVTAPIRADMVRLEEVQKTIVAKQSTHELGAHFLTTAQLDALKEHIVEVQSDVRYLVRQSKEGG